jgi:hypothetical protein
VTGSDAWYWLVDKWDEFGANLINYIQKKDNATENNLTSFTINGDIKDSTIPAPEPDSQAILQKAYDPASNKWTDIKPSVDDPRHVLDGEQFTSADKEKVNEQIDWHFDLSLTNTYRINQLLEIEILGASDFNQEYLYLHKLSNQVFEISTDWIYSQDSTQTANVKFRTIADHYQFGYDIRIGIINDNGNLENRRTEHFYNSPREISIDFNNGDQLDMSGKLEIGVDQVLSKSYLRAVDTSNNSIFLNDDSNINKSKINNIITHSDLSNQALTSNEQNTLYTSINNLPAYKVSDESFDGLSASNKIYTTYEDISSIAGVENYTLHIWANGKIRFNQNSSSLFANIGDADNTNLTTILQSDLSQINMELTTDARNMFDGVHRNNKNVITAPDNYGGLLKIFDYLPDNCDITNIFWMAYGNVGLNTNISIDGMPLLDLTDIELKPYTTSIASQTYIGGHFGGLYKTILFNLNDWIDKHQNIRANNIGQLHAMFGYFGWQDGLNIEIHSLTGKFSPVIIATMDDLTNQSKIGSDVKSIFRGYGTWNGQTTTNSSVKFRAINSASATKLKSLWDGRTASDGGSFGIVGRCNSPAVFQYWTGAGKPTKQTIANNNDTNWSAI